VNPEVPEVALADIVEAEPRPTDADQLHRDLRRLGRFLSSVGAFSAVQGLTQALGLVAGVLWVRSLPVGEFAIYTMASSVITLAAILSDLGAGSALQHYFHLHKGDVARFAPFVQAVRSIRRWLGALVSPGLLLAGWLWISRDGARTWATALPAALLLGSVFSQQEATIRLVVLRLQGEWPRVYRSELALAALRLAGAACLSAWRAASVNAALATNLAATLLATRLARLKAIPPASASPAERRQVLRFLLPILPDTLYFAFQGQLVIWIAAIAGNTREVAEVGALARIGLLFAVPQSLALNYLVPRMAHLHDDRAFRAATFRYSVFLALLVSAMGIAAAAAPAPFLWILGKEYGGLAMGLVLVVGNAAIGLLGGFFAQINRLRGWTRSLWKAIFLAIVGQVGYGLAVPLSTSEGVLGLGLVATVALSASHLVMTIVGMARSARREQPA
jgi:O-antigen/teichoic acid export membrane protein